MSASISLEVHIAPGRCGHKKIRTGKKPKHTTPNRLPRITKLMALAIKYEQLLDSGQIEGQDALARLAGMDRSSISRLLRLRLLSPRIQEQLLELPQTDKGREKISMRAVEALVRIHDWCEQEVRFKKFKTIE